MFPARAGVILMKGCTRLNRYYVPRASGGDPTSVTETYTGAVCSPRERG